MGSINQKIREDAINHNYIMINLQNSVEAEIKDQASGMKVLSFTTSQVRQGSTKRKIGKTIYDELRRPYILPLLMRTERSDFFTDGLPSWC